MDGLPTTEYAKNGDVHLAYQVVGGGSLDLVLIESWVHIPIMLSLGVVLVVLLASILASLKWPKAQPMLDGTTGSIFGRGPDRG